MDDQELLRLARRLATSARPPLLDLYQRFIELLAVRPNPVIVPKSETFDRKAYMREYMRGYMKRRREKGD